LHEVDTRRLGDKPSSRRITINSALAAWLSVDQIRPTIVKDVALSWNTGVSLAVLYPRHFIIPDEPTKHLDLDTVAALEAALISYDSALLVVSHDQAFLGALTLSRTISLP
jgi:hypothetical protein